MPTPKPFLLRHLWLPGIISLTLMAAVFRVAVVETALLPADQAGFPWESMLGSDTGNGEGSSIQLNDSRYALDADFSLSREHQYPYVSVGLVFANHRDPGTLVDWTAFSHLRLTIRCRPANVLTFALYTFDPQVTRAEDFSSYRASTAFVSCKEEWSEVEVDLRHLSTPEWWLQEFGQAFSNQAYQLDQVVSVGFLNSAQSPVEQDSSLTISQLALVGYRWDLISIVLATLALIWIGIALWFLSYRRNNSERAEAVANPGSDHSGGEAGATVAGEGADAVPAHKPVEVEPRRERDRSRVLEYLNSHYADPELTLEAATSRLGINRNRMNDILRGASGLTFKAYLNQLRLQEAGRLILEKDMNVTEVAYAVGYKNVSYFSRLFKETYGCAPTAYRQQTSN